MAVHVAPDLGAPLSAVSSAGIARVADTRQTAAREFWTDARVIALADAAARGDVGGVRAAKMSGADPNAVGKDGMIPLLYAMIAKSHAGMRALLGAGADPNAPGPPDFPLLASAAGADDPELLRILLDGGANPSAKNADGEPLLHAAVFQKRWANLHTLVERGADVNGATKSRTTVMMLCAGLGYWDQVAYLLEHGADPMVPELSGSTLPYEVEDALARGRGGQQAASLQRVHDLLVARGVKFPAETPREVRKRVFGIDGPPSARGRGPEAPATP